MLLTKDMRNVEYRKIAKVYDYHLEFPYFYPQAPILAGLL